MDLNRFPMELWPYILSNLDLIDLARCRAVNRTFKQASEEAKPKELSVQGLNELLFFRSTFKFHRHLKQLYLEVGFFEKLDSNTLSDFPKLDSLTIAGYLPNSDETITLNLPELAEFTFNDYHYGDGRYSLRLNTPKLKRLSVPDLNNVSLAYPEALTHLDCDFCDLKVRECKNLQVLKCNRFLESISDYTREDDLVLQLPQLKELHLNMACLERDYGRSRDYDFAIEALKDYLRQRETLNRLDLMITLRNVLLVDTKQLGYPAFSFIQNAYNFQLKNYRLLLDEPQFDHPVSNDWANYSYVQDQISDRVLRGGFLEKSRISRVEISNGNFNPDDFFWFLKQFPKLDSLKLVDARSFYPKLTELTDLKMLSVEESDESIRLPFPQIGPNPFPPFDLSLVFKFNKLEHFELDSDHSVEILHFIRAAFMKGRPLEEFKCRMKRFGFIEIKKHPATRKLELSIRSMNGSCEFTFCPTIEMQKLCKVIETVLFYSDNESPDGTE